MLLNKQRLNSRNRCQAASIIIEDLNLQKKFHTVDIEDTEEQTTETEQPSTDTEGSTQTTEKSTEQSSEQSLSGAGTATDQSVEHTVNTPLTQN